MSDFPARILLPPVATLLEYAAYGWSADRGDVSTAGRPRLPNSAVWLPEFAAMLAAPDGLARLERFALIGMQAWGVDPSISAVLPAAFASPGLVDRLAALCPGPCPILPAGLMAASDPLPSAPAPLVPARLALAAPVATGNETVTPNRPPGRARIRRPQPA
jgi:hypothetical protein